MSERKAIISIKDVTKRFPGGVTAVDTCNLVASGAFKVAPCSHVSLYWKGLVI